MNPLNEIKQQLVCPTHRCTVQFHSGVLNGSGVPWPDGPITCPMGCTFSIHRGIPRFVSPDNYASAFGLQWQRWRKTQLDSYTGQPYSRRRLEACMGMPPQALNEKTVLECGSGAGRFTEHLLENANCLVSMDLSDAVDANLMNCAGKRPYLLVQADINASPIPFGAFDVVVCMGMLQHTPSPEQTISSLAKYLKSGGLLVIDHYTIRSPLGKFGRNLTLGYPIRAIIRRLSPQLGLKITIALTALCNPIRKRTCQIHWIDRIASRIFPSSCYYKTLPLLDPDIIYEWNELDTHDTLTDYYKHFRSPEEIRGFLEELGFQDIWCGIAGNAVQARAIAP